MNNRPFYSILFLFIITYLLIACYKLSSPGLHYDEILFVSGAQYPRYYNEFVFKQFHGIPIMLMKYIGALKAYIYFPIVNIFGMSVWSIRLPVILITACSLFIFSTLVRKATSNLFALIVIAILALDPVFIFMTRVDQGPNVLEFFLKCLSGLFFYRYFIEKKPERELYIGLIALGLGLFNKLNFIWYINSLYACILVFQFNSIRKGISIKNRTLLRPYFFICLSYLLYLCFFITIGILYVKVGEEVNTENVFLSAKKKIQLLGRVVSGNSFIYMLYKAKPDSWNTLILYFYGLVTLVGGILTFKYKENSFIKQHKEKYIFCLLMIVFHIVQILLTKSAGAPWHTFSLYPFFTLVFIYSIFCIYHIISAEKLYLKNTLLVMPIVIGILYQVYTLRKHFNLLGTPTTSVAFSEQIYALIDFTKKSDKKFASLDWGIQNALTGYDNKKDKYYEPFWSINNADITSEAKEKLFNAYMTDTSFVYIIHPEGREYMPFALQNFKQVAKEHNMHLVHLKTFRDERAEVFRLYSLQKKE